MVFYDTYEHYVGEGGGVNSQEQLVELRAVVDGDIVFNGCNKEVRVAIAKRDIEQLCLGIVGGRRT